MPTDYRGITLTLDLNDTDFTKKLNQLQRNITTLDGFLKKVNNALKLDPSNVDLLNTKTKLLNQKQEELTNNLKEYQNALDQQHSRGFEDTDKRIIELRAKIVQVKQELWEIKTLDLSESLENLSKTFSGLSKASTSIGNAFKGISTLSGGALVGATKETIELEDSMASVNKVLDVTDFELNQLELAFRNLSLEIPKSADEIAEVGAIAGQLGVPTENLVDFTETVLMMETAFSNMDAETIATSIAQIFNITGSDLSNVSNFASALTELGNNSATTEANILEFANRLASASSSIGLTDQELLALSTTLASTGLYAEAGGSAISTIFTTIDKLVATNGENLQAWADATNMSVEEFRNAWENDAFGTIKEVIGALGNAEESGSNLNVMLDELGVNSIRQTDSMRRLSQAYEQLDYYAEMSNEAFEENIALQEEFDKRNETVKAQVTLLKNNIVDLGYDIGEVVLPYLVKFTDKAKEIITKIKEWVANNPQLATTLMTITTAISPLFLGLGKIFGKLSSVTNVVKELIKRLPTIISKLKGLISPMTLIISGLALLYATNEEFRESVNNFVTKVWASLKPILTTVVTFIQRIFEVLAPLISDLVDILAPILADIIDSITTIWELLDSTGIFDAVNEFLEFVLGIIGEIVSFIEDIISKVKEFLELIGVAKTEASELSAIRENGHGGGGSHQFSSLGFGNLSKIQSGGFASGGITLSTNINVTSNNVTKADVQMWARTMADTINEELGRAI